MKIVFATLALSVVTALTACQNTTSIPVLGAGANQMVDTTRLANILTAYHWTYQSPQTDKPIVYTFLSDRLSVSTGCNTLITPWKIVDGKIETGQTLSTMMACSDPLMKQEQFAATLIDNRKIPISLTQTDTKTPVLTIEASDGKKYQFIGSETSETKYQGQGETIFWEVSPETKPCTGVAPSTCLQVREIKYDPAGIKSHVGKWVLFYGNIEGFKHDPNVRTVLRLKRFTLPNPAADQSKYAYVHDMTVESEMVK